MTCSAGPLSPALSDNEHAVSLPKPDTDSVVLVRYIYMPCHGTSGSSDRVPPPMPACLPSMGCTVKGLSNSWRVVRKQKVVYSLLSNQRL